MMTKNETELLYLIQSNDEPEKAIMTATSIILDFLKQHESSEEQVSAYPRGLD